MPKDPTPEQPANNEPTELSHYKPADADQDLDALYGEAASDMDASGSEHVYSPTREYERAAEQTNDTQPAGATSRYTPPVAGADGGSSWLTRSKVIVLATAVGALVLLGGGSAAAYNLWYQHPDKVLSDSLLHFVTTNKVASKGTVQLTTSEDVSLKLTYDNNNDGGSPNMTSTNAALEFDVGMDEVEFKGKIKGSLITAGNGDMYFRAQNVKSFADTYLETSFESYSSVAETLLGEQLTAADEREFYDAMRKVIDPIVQKVDNQWIKITPADLKKQDESLGEMSECLEKANEKLRTDAAVKEEIVTLYKAHPFMHIKDTLGAKNGALGYKIGLDTAKANEFSDKLSDTAYVRELNKCDIEDVARRQLDSVTNDDVFTVTKSSFEVWVNRWSHTVKQVKLSMHAKQDNTHVSVDGDMTFDFDNATAVELPKNTMSLRDFEKEIETLTGSIFGEAFNDEYGSGEEMMYEYDSNVSRTETGQQSLRT